MNDEETRLKNILQKLKDPQVSLKKSINLYRSANIDWPATLDKKRKGEEVKECELKLKIIERIIDKEPLSEPLGKTSEERKEKFPQLSDEQFDFVDLMFNETMGLYNYLYFNWNSFTDTEKERLKNDDLLKGSEKTFAEVESEIKGMFEEMSKFASELKSEKKQKGENQKPRTKSARFNFFFAG